MPDVNMQQPLSVPAVPARAALSAILHDIADERGGWADFALYANLRSFSLPDVGYIAVPVKLSNLEETTEPQHEIRFHLQSRRGAESFPVLEGKMGVDSSGPSSAMMWLGGSYTIPMSGIGGLINQTLFRGTADASLGTMLDELATAVVARVENRERAESRYRLLFKAGD